MSSEPEALHPIELAILKSLSSTESASMPALSEMTGLGMDQIRRGVEWLRLKGMVAVSENTGTILSLGSAGIESATSGLPERRLVNAVRDGISTLAGIVAGGRLGQGELNAAVAAAKRNGWIRFGDAGSITAELANKSSEEELISKLQAGALDASNLDEIERKALDLLSKRPGYIVKKEFKNAQISLTGLGKSAAVAAPSGATFERTLTPKMITSGSWKDVKLAPLDVEAPAPTIYPGRRHPLVDVIDEIKEIFVGLGFGEVDGPIIQTGFWNFDALYIPQDHSAREMQDTFYVSGHRQEIAASKDQTRRVAKIHEHGWGSRWDVKEAQRVVLRTHTTPVTLRHLALTRPSSGRFFSIGRVFRNEKPSYKHLVEFHQVEGVATSPGLTLRDLMGLQKEFYLRMGIRKVKFWPTFFPYTEPSLQSMVYNERLQKWVELFGMGIFRPQVTLPFGIKNPVLAWGGGIERIAMLRYGIDDVRELYANRLSWLRGVPACPL